LLNTVDVLPVWSTRVKTGGRLNVDRALRNQTVCTFNLSATELYISSTGGTSSVGVTAPTNCDYPIKSNVSWVEINSADNGSSNGTVNFTVKPNPIPDMQRIGTISIGDRTFTVIQGTPFLAGQRILDFDGDGRTDFSAIQNNAGGMIWHNQRSILGYSAASFGIFADDIPVANDYDGDSRTDIAVWRNSTGVFYVLRSSNNTFQALQFGLTGDNPNVSQDFDGDGKTDFAVTRVQGNALVWYIQGSTAGFSAIQFGLDTDKPVRAIMTATGVTIWRFFVLRRELFGFGGVQIRTVCLPLGLARQAINSFRAITTVMAKLTLPFGDLRRGFGIIYAVQTEFITLSPSD
ncbi:MAG TPA: hypothetical protein PKE69_09755, partial [Pyrinomonadaceae bacterium]|nr:hypothetical protein [Pyrinomonadaceae bacterium]